MSTSPLARFDVPPSKRAAVSALSKVPFVSPAVLGLFLFSFGGVISTDVLAVNGVIGLGWACVLNCFFMYWQFTVVHDAIHRSAARGQRLNDWFGRAGLATFAPHVGLGIFRWAHVQHHRYTNGERDPDVWMHCPWWQIPFRWLSIDVGYVLFVLQKGDPVGRRHLLKTLVNTLFTLGVAGALVYLGYGWEVLFLWFIPSRVTFFIVGFVFFWLPHVKDDVSAEQDLTLASSVRLGHEWLMTPLCQFHNYHLIHHLFPTMPSYRHLKAWRLLEPELMRRNLQIQHGLALHPTVHLGQGGAS